MASSSDVAKPLRWEELRSYHQREWALGDDRLTTIAHNLMPVVGITLLGWSGALTLGSLWLDGLLGLGLSVALLVHRTSLDPPVVTLSRGQFLFTWLLFMAILGVPYYWGFYERAGLLIDGFTSLYDGSSLSALTVLAMVVANVLSVRGRWRAESQLLPRSLAVAREMTVHAVRAIAVLVLLTFWISAPVAVVALSLLYAYLEVFPNTLLLFLIGHPAKGSPYAEWKAKHFPEGALEP